MRHEIALCGSFVWALPLLREELAGRQADNLRRMEHNDPELHYKSLPAPFTGNLTQVSRCRRCLVRLPF